MGETPWELQALLVKKLREEGVLSEHRWVDFEKSYLAVDVLCYDLGNTGHMHTILTSSYGFLDGGAHCCCLSSKGQDISVANMCYFELHFVRLCHFND